MAGTPRARARDPATNLPVSVLQVWAKEMVCQPLRLEALFEYIWLSRVVPPLKAILNVLNALVSTHCATEGSQEHHNDTAIIDQLITLIVGIRSRPYSRKLQTCLNLKWPVLDFEVDHLGFCSRPSWKSVADRLPVCSRLSSTQLQMHLNFEIDCLGFSNNYQPRRIPNNYQPRRIPNFHQPCGLVWNPKSLFQSAPL